MIPITEKFFDEIYKGTSGLSAKHLLYSKPRSKKELLTKYLPSKLWRLNNLYTIIDKRHKRVQFKMNLGQHRSYAAHLIHSRQIALKSRQQGISTLWLVSFFDDAMTIPDLNIGLMAQGKSEASTLLERTKLLWETFPIGIKQFLRITQEKSNKTEFALSNKSKIYVSTSFRSATLHRLHISELGKIANKYPEKAKETKTGSLQSIAPGNTVVIESTAEGVNLFKAMWDIAKSISGTLAGKDFYPLFLSWLDDPDCVSSVPQKISKAQHKYFLELEQATGKVLTPEQKNFWVIQYRELQDDIYQEYPGTAEEAFLVSRQGSYYAKFFITRVKNTGRIRPNLYDPNLGTQIAVDLGMNNDTALVFFQHYMNDFRVIDEYHNSGEDIEHYANVIMDKKYHITNLILPHDANVRELTSGFTRMERFSQFGFNNITLLKRTPVADRIELFRKTLHKLYIDPKCTYLLDCIYNYSRDFDEKHNVWKKEPLKSIYNNGADALGYMSQGVVKHHPYKPSRRANSSINMDV